MNKLKKSNGTFNVGRIIIIRMLLQESLFLQRCFILVMFNEETSNIIGFGEVLPPVH
jgi:hypothetical protein